MSGGTPYIGSKISLLSKSNIRYVGTLYSIDTTESTVTLANVRSFGTEDRPVERNVPASKEVYEYIVFRGSDIKDLHVSERPKAQSPPTPQLPQDPAIVQSSSQAMRSGYSPFAAPTPYGTNTYGPFGGMPYYPLGMQQSPFLTSPGSAQTPIHPQRIPTPPMIDPTRVRTPTPPPVIPPIGVSPSSQLKTQETQTKDQKQQATQTTKKKPSSRRNSVDKQKQETPKADSKLANNNEEMKTPPTKEAQKVSTSKEENRKQGNEGEKTKSTQGTPAKRGNRGGRGSTAPRIPRPQPERVDGDFDFESANARFNKDEMNEEMRLKLKETLKITDDEIPMKVEGDEDLVDDSAFTDPVKFYDKEKSFFDNISCEARGESRGRPYWQEERRLNVETFGISTSRRGGPRGRGRGGGYRGNRGGRGRYNGRGGRGNWRGVRGARGGSRGGNRERTWVDYDYDYAAAGLPVPENKMSNGPSEPSSTAVH